jgi:hypothetical protein
MPERKRKKQLSKVVVAVLGKEVGYGRSNTGFV